MLNNSPFSSKPTPLLMAMPPERVLFFKTSVRGEEAVRADKPKSNTISSAYSRRNNIIVERMV
jgi:hypothetical protein